MGRYHVSAGAAVLSSDGSTALRVAVDFAPAGGGGPQCGGEGARRAVLVLSVRERGAFRREWEAMEGLHGLLPELFAEPLRAVDPFDRPAAGGDEGAGPGAEGGGDVLDAERPFAIVMEVQGQPGGGGGGGTSP